MVVPIQRNAFCRGTPLHTAAAAVPANKFNPLSYRLDSVVIFSSTADFSRLSRVRVYTLQHIHTQTMILHYAFQFCRPKRKTVRELLLLLKNVRRDGKIDCRVLYTYIYTRSFLEKKYMNNERGRANKGVNYLKVIDRLKILLESDCTLQRRIIQC